MSGRDLVGTTRGLAGLSALLATVSAGYHVLSGFSNGIGKERAVFEEYIHYVAVESRLTLMGELGMLDAREVIAVAAKGAVISYG